MLSKNLAKRFNDLLSNDNNQEKNLNSISWVASKLVDLMTRTKMLNTLVAT